MTEPVDADDDAPPDVPSRAPARTRRRPRRGVLVASGLAVLVAPFLIAGAWFWWQLDPPGARGGAVTVSIPAGTGVSGIGDRLHSAGVIGSSLAFKVYVGVSGGGPYRSGQYKLRRNMGVRAAAGALQKGPSILKLALPPGLTLDQIAARVGALPGLSADRFLALARSGTVRSKYEPPGVTTVEGLTWPDTYVVDRGESEARILRLLVGAFDENADRIGLSNTGALGVSPYQALVVASMIQAEARLDVDRPLIAAVVYNRLHDGMPLQIDATVKYARGGGDAPLTSDNFALDSPYNTYKVKGLPPTPIMTSAEVSIRAALAPANAPFLYYVVIDPSGKHAFSVTYAQHLQNVAEARRKGLL
ncbi:MAG: endolytic transglycosylase MltG [Actinobacteria bacterium]|nr:endolytic transglycosylase MltG [Actinomycetota bacterium]